MLAGLALLAARAVPVPGGDRSVAITFDDLPGPPAGLASNGVADVRENTRKLLATLTEHHVPVVGFVNEGKLFMEGEGPADAEARKAVLKMWVDEYIYAAVYADALRRGDRATASAVGADYLRYMESVFAFVEDVSRRLVGREVRQVLLLHANTLNADCYRLPDPYVGRWGISWLHHWELAAGRKRSPSPDPPGWVMKAYEALPR